MNNKPAGQASQVDPPTANAPELVAVAAHRWLGDALAADSFTPDPSRAAGLDRAVRAGLAESLRTVFDSLDTLLAVDRRRAEPLLQSIVTSPVRPRVFGAYVELVVALFDDRAADARSLLDELLDNPPDAPDAARIVTLDDGELGLGQSERYRRFVNDDVQFLLDPVSADERAAAMAVLNPAFDLLRNGAPAVFGEYRALVRELVLVAGRGGPDGLVIGGASTFSLWGALFLNVGQLGDRLTAALSLTHESAHSHVLGLARGGRLVENDDDERYNSPLRRDPRPMEGVAHATYVLARMIYMLRSVIASGRLDTQEIDHAHDRLAQNLSAYDEGMATLLGGARFTPVGATAFEHLQLYMGRR